MGGFVSNPVKATTQFLKNPGGAIGLPSASKLMSGLVPKPPTMVPPPPPPGPPPMAQSPQVTSAGTAQQKRIAAAAGNAILNPTGAQGDTAPAMTAKKKLGD